MQATTAETQASPAELASAMFALFAFLLASSTPDFFRALSELDLSLTQVKLLNLLDRQEPDLSLKELAEEMSFSLAAASRSIDAMHQRELVVRREDEHDRRMKRVRITDAGRDVLRRLNQMRLALLEQFAQTMTDAQRRDLLAAISPLAEREEIAAHRPEGLTAR